MSNDWDWFQIHSFEAAEFNIILTVPVNLKFSPNHHRGGVWRSEKITNIRVKSIFFGVAAITGDTPIVSEFTWLLPVAMWQDEKGLLIKYWK